MAEKTFKSGEVIFQERTYEACMYELLEGTVGIYTHYGQQDEKLLTELKAENGAYFGEMGLVESMPRSATAVALADVRVNVITGADFGAFFTKNPERVYAVMTQMGGRIRELTRDYLDACRAASELVDGQGNGQEKSGWFNSFIEKIRTYLDSEDVREGLKYASSGYYFYDVPFGFYWI